MKTIIGIFALCSLLQVLHAQVPYVGSCPNNIQTVEDFDAKAYLGRWYEYAKYPFVFELNGKCVIAEYGALDNGEVSVYNTNLDRLTNIRNSIKGSARIYGPGKLSVTFDSLPAFVGAADYWVLGTDYDNYAVVYSCTPVFGIFHTKVVWILTRERLPADDVIKQAKDIITKNGLSLAPLNRTEQDKCPTD